MEDTFDLVGYFSKEEVRNAINDLGKEKALGPNGVQYCHLPTLSGRCQGGLDGVLH